MYPTKGVLAHTLDSHCTLKTPLLVDHKYLMLTLYRIVLERTGETLANGMDSVQAYETHAHLELDYPQEKLAIERYSVSSVSGLGRDPDLH